LTERQRPQSAYPPAREMDVVDVYHGERIADPFRWLEDPASDETKRWVEAQNQLTEAWLSGNPGRPAVRKRLRELWSHERWDVPFKRGGRYFFTHNSGLQNQGVLHSQETLESEPRVVLDPNLLSEDGTVSLAAISVSPDGSHLAYATSSGGSDWVTWRCRDLRTGLDLDDEIRWSKFSDASWRADGSGFFYSSYDPPEREEDALTGVNYYQKLYFHRLGQPQADDELIYERRDQKEWGFGGKVSDDGRWLVISVWRGTERRTQIFYRDLEEPDGSVHELLAGFDAQWEFIGNDGPLFWLRTDKDAPRGRIVGIDIRRPQPSDWLEVVPQTEHALEAARAVGGHIVAEYLEHASSRVRIFEPNGGHVRDIELPGPGSVGGFHGRFDDPETFYAFTSFTQPTTIYRYDVRSGEQTVFRQPAIDFDPSRFVTRQVLVTSRDGTKVPMFLTHRRDIKPGSEPPTVLSGYGGFNISLTPTFSIGAAVWLELGGVHAVANLRGGGEYGEEWHRAGTLLDKQNVFDDFIAAAEWLIENGTTSRRRLAIAGGSNGGLLVGACVTQRPDLFAAAIAANGVLDMLRYHQWTIGWAWASDYGTADDHDEYRALRAYSPLHNVRDGVAYPATMITTADHDDRVVPAHSYKFAAALQRAQAADRPVLIRIDTRAGHGAGKPTDKLVAEVTDRWAFLLRALEYELPTRD